MKVKFIKGIKDAIAPLKVQEGVYMLFAAEEPKLIQPIDGDLSLVYTSGHAMQIEGNGLAILTPLNDISTKTLQSDIVFVNSGEITSTFKVTNKRLNPIAYKKSEPFALLIMIEPTSVEVETEDLTITNVNTDNNEQAIVQSDDATISSEKVAEPVEETQSNI